MKQRKKEKMILRKREKLRRNFKTKLMLPVRRRRKLLPLR
jgi:hypothetical protein